MVALASLETRNLVSRAVESLRKFILEEMVGPEADLPSQGELCEKLGVSRTVVREAMRILESQGLIEISQGKVPRVLPANTHAVIHGLSTLMERSSVSLLDVLEVRRPLEIQAAVLAAERATDEHLSQMQEANEALAKVRTIEEQILADMRFHKVIAEATGNPVFGIVLDVLAQFLFESRRTTLKQSGAKVALRHHQRLHAAIAARDIAQVRQAAEEGMRQTEADLKREARQATGAKNGKKRK
jgi:DNA-binding FadR family transcriptional regulator